MFWFRSGFVLLPESDSALGHVVWAHFNSHSIAWKNSDKELSHLAADIGQDFVAILKFDSKHPHRIVVTGRIKHFISAFGEHVIGKEVEQALQEAVEGTDIRINEFTVAPQITPKEGLPYHEWFIEFENAPENLEDFALRIDHAMRKQNTYYDDLIVGNVLRTLVISKVEYSFFTCILSPSYLVWLWNRFKDC